MPAFIKLSSALAIAWFASAFAVAAQEFQGLGDLPGGAVKSDAFGVSADGTVVVGWSNGAKGVEAFRWTKAGGLVGLGFASTPALSSIATAANADGTVVVGVSHASPSVAHAFRWTKAGGMVDLGDLPGGTASSYANAVNPSGDVIVGSSMSASGKQAFLWTKAGGMVGLGDLPGGLYSSGAAGVSADGGVVVGQSLSLIDGEAFRWTKAGGMIGMGDFPGGIDESFASAISADGTTIVGGGYKDFLNNEAFRWTKSSGMRALRDLPAGGIDGSYANAVSANGAVVVGATIPTGPYGPNQAFRWTPAHGMQTIASLLVSQGVPIGGWKLSEARGVSADGTVIVGWGINPAGNVEAWRARVALPACAAPLQGMAFWLSLDTDVMAPDLIASLAPNVDGGGAARDLQPTTIFGHAGKVLRLKTPNARMSFANNPNSPFGFKTEDFSLAAWVRIDSVTGFNSIVDARRDAPGNTHMGVQLFVENGSLGFEMRDTAKTSKWLTAANIGDGAFHHVAVTVDRDQAGGGRLYVDGVPALMPGGGETFDPTAHKGAALGNNNPMVIGHDRIANVPGAPLLVDEVQSYRRALSAQDVGTLWQSPTCR